MNSTPTRDRVLDAAARVFLAHGYADASMEQVRQMAGVSNGSLYHHFPTKTGLADALYGQILQDFHRTLLDRLRAGDSAEAGVKGMVRAFVSWVVRHPDRAALLHKLRREGDVTDASAPVSAANAEAFGALKAWVEARRAANELADIPFDVWMALVFSPTVSLAARWARAGQPSVSARTRAALEQGAWKAVSPESGGQA